MGLVDRVTCQSGDRESIHSILAPIIYDYAGPRGRIHAVDNRGQTLRLSGQIGGERRGVQAVVTLEDFLRWIEYGNCRSVGFDPEKHPVAVNPQDVSHVRRILQGREDPRLGNLPKVCVVGLQEEFAPGHRQLDC